MSEPEPLADVVARGDRKASLTALRDYLAAQLDDNPAARDVAALAARLVAVINELDALPGEERSPADAIREALAAKQSARSSGAKSSRRSRSR